jgi:hypothetical protein
MSYPDTEVRNKLDGLSMARVRAYTQTKGNCTGVCMEWIRKMLVTWKKPDKGALGPRLRGYFDEDAEKFQSRCVRGLTELKWSRAPIS